jgi:1-deoxy-D-xylulose-5-phosphate reductoisomerase
MQRHARKRILLIGATGSIGQSVQSVVRTHRDRFQIVGVGARKLSDGLIAAAKEFDAESLAVTDEADASVAQRQDLSTRDWLAGSQAVLQQVERADYDLLVNAVVGNAGLEPTMIALGRGRSVALANKETLVAAGPLVMAAATATGAQVLPIDSEHSAIFQCLLGEMRDSIRTIWLTTSGGPFWEKSFSDLQSVTPDAALGHPTWKMGPKISVDSATLFNKGLEVIEAVRLFGVRPEQVQIVAHRQSVVHSMVEFNDGSFKAQWSVPDMRLPILFALSYPDRVPSQIVETRLQDFQRLTFEPVASENFPCLQLALHALQRGGTTPAALSAADELAVGAFLNGQILFTEIPQVIESVLKGWPDESLSSLQTVLDADRRARTAAGKVLAVHLRKVENRIC